MRLSLSLLLAAFVALSGCDATTPSEAADSSSDDIIAAHAVAASSSSCAAPSLQFGPLSSFGSNTVVATPALSSDVSVSIEENLSWVNNWNPVHGEAYNGSAVNYATDWGPAEGRPDEYASYRARTMCANGFISGYSNTITTGIEL